MGFRWLWWPRYNLPGLLQPGLGGLYGMLGITVLLKGPMMHSLQLPHRQHDVFSHDVLKREWIQLTFHSSKMSLSILVPTLLVLLGQCWSMFQSPSWESLLFRKCLNVQTESSVPVNTKYCCRSFPPASSEICLQPLIASFVCHVQVV